MSKTITVVGAGGYVGNALCRMLLDNFYSVRAYDNFHKGHCDSLISLSSSPRFHFEYGDVTNEDHVKQMVKDVDGIVNLAAIVGFPACSRCPSLAEITNVEGTRLLLKHKNDIPLVFASTGSVYGKVEDVCTEESPKNTNTIYGLTKWKAEQLVSEANNTVSFRFATGFGVSANMRVNLLVNDLVYQAIRNRSMCIFEADARRTFIHVRDMARAFIFGLENIGKLEHKVYNAGDDKLNWTKRELCNYICEKTGAYVSYIDFAKDLDCRDYEVSYQKLNKAGFRCNIGMEEGIDELLRVVPLLQDRNPYA